MATQVQIRRGTTAQHSTFTGAAGEITIDTDKKTVVVHDGTTVSGKPLAPNTAFDIANTAFGFANGVSTNAAAAFGVANAAYNASNNNTGLQNTNITISGNVVSIGTVSDSKGDLRSTPINAQTASYVLTTGDNGKTISTNTGVTVPNTVISSGQMFSIFNNSASSITVTSAGGITMYLGGSSTTGNRTLATYGVATIVCVAANTFVITGAGLT